MPEQDNLPRVDVIPVIRPANAGTGEERLVADGLHGVVVRYRQTNSRRWDAFFASESGSLEEKAAAEQLASEYLLDTADRLQGTHTGNRDVWADRFTEASSELYGAPEAVEAAHLVTQEYTGFAQLKDKPGISQDSLARVLQEYGAIASSAPVTGEAQAEADREKQVIHEYGVAVKERYRQLFELVDQTGKETFTPEGLQTLFTDALAWMREHDGDDWQEWALKLGSGTSLSVLPRSRRVRIASSREDASADEARRLLAHELLVHALRAQNGYRAGSQELAKGLAGYTDAEEGLGVLMEEAVTGQLPDKTVDRYTDISLALGLLDGMQRTRRQLYELVSARYIVREQARGGGLSSDDIAALQRKAWVHVDRIYRGGPGDGMEASQAIFTKDAAYYAGYRKIARYIADELEGGKAAAEIFDFLSRGKFDPTNQQHLEVVSAVYGGVPGQLPVNT